MKGGYEGDVAAAQQVVAMHDRGDDELRGAGGRGGAQLDGDAEVEVRVVFAQKDFLAVGFVDFEDANAFFGGICRGCGKLFGGFEAKASDHSVAHAHEGVDPSGLIFKHVAGELLRVGGHVCRQADGEGVCQVGR